MTSNDGIQNCEQARLYYYDYLNERQQDVPPEVLVHIEQCDFCRADIEKLGGTLDEEISDVTKISNDTVTKNLGLHFDYLGKAVTCDVVKPFLPGQADRLLHISIPTPITTHIDNCQQCLEDLKAIKDLELGQIELCKLAQFYAYESSEDHKLDEIFPEGIHEQLQNIHKRPNSSVVTIFNTKEDTGETLDKCSPDSYADYPIEVKILNNSEESKSVDSKPVFLKFKSFSKPIAVAAGILVLAILIFQGPSVKAVDISAIYSALEHIRNICMTTFTPERTEPTQTIWVSRDMNIKVFQTGSQWALWNLNEKSLSTKKPDTEQVSKIKLDDNSILSVQGTMTIPWGLLPFENPSDVPENHTWHQIETQDLETTIAETEVYDLHWTETSLGGTTVYNRWRGYIALDTKLPLRVERWYKNSELGDYTIATAINITYPTEQEIKRVINQAGF